MKKFASLLAAGIFLLAGNALAQSDFTRPIVASNSYQLVIKTGTAPAGEVPTLANRLCLYRVDVDPVQQVICYSPSGGASATFPQGFELAVTLSFTAPQNTEPQFRALARNTLFDPVKESELSPNKMTIVRPDPASPVLQ